MFQEHTDFRVFVPGIHVNIIKFFCHAQCTISCNTVIIQLPHQLVIIFVRLKDRGIN